MFLLFEIFVAIVAAALFLVLTSSALVPISVSIPSVLRESTQVFWTFKREFIWLKRNSRYRKRFLFLVTFIILFGKHNQKEILNQQVHFFSMRDIDCLDIMQYDHILLAQGQYSLDGAVLVNQCNHQPLWLNFYLGWVVFKFLLFFNSSNVLVTLEILCIFYVLDQIFLHMVFDWSISLQIPGLHFLIIKEFNFQV